VLIWVRIVDNTYRCMFNINNDREVYLSIMVSNSDCIGVGIGAIR
jgi:uncharacterized protein YdaL